MNQHAESHFDVLIMGGGFAGNCQARHLLRKIPGIKVGVIEPRTDEEIATIHKIGESTVEIAANFLTRELGLVDYMIENHPPKNGLNFHWPKDPARTEEVDDYYSIWATRYPKIGAYQVHRGKLEADLCRMNRDAGVHWIKGKVKDFDLGAGAAPHRLDVLVEGNPAEFTADHLVDAASRAFLTGKKTKNIKVGPKNLFGLNTGTAWLRVKGVDKTIFSDGADPLRTATSHYYCTNHWFGHGHWLWMIPICKEEQTLSIGVVCHHDVLPGKEVNTEDKFRAFLKANHGILDRLVESGEIEDFVYWTRPSHLCEQMFSEDNWYAIGDAAYFGDAFYSLGTSTIALAVESVTEVVRAKRSGEADAEEKRAAFDQFNTWYGGTVVHLYRDHAKHLGHASVMSWRIYLEYMWWFGFWVPMYMGKWHLDANWCRTMIRNCERHFFAYVYRRFTKVIDEQRNPGWIDAYRSDQLAFGFAPTEERDNYLEDTVFEPLRLNIYKTLAQTYFMTAVWLCVFEWKAFGLKGLLRPQHFWQVLRLTAKGAYVTLGSMRHLWQNRKRHRSAPLGQLEAEMADYRYTEALQPWSGRSNATASGQVVRDVEGLTERPTGT